MLKFTPVLILCALLVSCATTPPQTASYDPLHNAAGNYVPKVDNFLVILDASYSMNESYLGGKKLTLARDTVSRMNRTIPPLDIKGALRTFGGGYCPFSKKTALIYGVENYNGPAFEQALATVTRAGGSSPLAAAITAAETDLANTAGPTALLVFSDGREMDNAPVSAASALKQKYGRDLCIYTIQIGNDANGRELLNRVAETGGCGFAMQADDLADRDQMDSFVKKVFLADRPDSDGDGVYDYLDKCPGTPEGARVNSMGCWVLGDVLFDTGKADIKASMTPVLDEVVDVLNKNPDMKVEVQGHTDNRGSKKFNQTLSENRAASIMNYLIEKGISRTRLTSVGYGFSRPIASNDTDQGRAWNRRVELKPEF